MIKLYQWEISPFCDKVRRVLAFKGQEYQVEEMTIADAINGKLKKLNAAAKVPVLEHDGRRIADSTEIVHHLDEAFPSPALLPEDPRERAFAHVLEDWADESLYFYEMHLRMVVPHNAQHWVPELLKNDSALMKRIGRFAVPRDCAMKTRAQGTGRKSAGQLGADIGRHVTAIHGILQDRDWLVGDAPSIADIAVFVQLFCIGGTAEGAAVLDSQPTVRAWMDRVAERTSPGSSSGD